MKVEAVADFECNTREDNVHCWAWGICHLEDESFYYGNSLDTFFEFIKSKFFNYKLYFHNLSYDGEFIISYLLNNGYKWVKDRGALETKTFTTVISDKNVFYGIDICLKKSGRNKKVIYILDSLKKLPFSVDTISQKFQLEVKKLELDYDTIRDVGHIITDKELEYLKHDCLIMARALKKAIDIGIDKMTIGKSALDNFKEGYTKDELRRFFPLIDYEVDKFIRLSYKGGYVYLKPGNAHKVINTGIVLDVNSLYPSKMKFKKMPYGVPVHYTGRYEPDEIYDLYVQQIRCFFDLKTGYLPTIQIKNNPDFVATEYQSTSGLREVTLTLTNIDLDIFFEHYDVQVTEWVEGYKFKSDDTFFDKYVDEWSARKIQAKIDDDGALYTIAKLFLNSCYGKFATNPEVQSKMPILDEKGKVKYCLTEREVRDGVYLPIGTFITAYAREETIRSGQKVYDRFIYCDTDSLHLHGYELPDCIPIDPEELGLWDHEFTFWKARYICQKRYILVGYNPAKPNKGEIMKITCAGMSEKCHKGNGERVEFINEKGKKEWAYQGVTFDNFQLGNTFLGKLVRTSTKGGVYLRKTTFRMLDKVGRMY